VLLYLYKNKSKQTRVMKKSFYQITALFIVITFLFSCRQSKIDQKNMFKGRSDKAKKTGHYNTGIRGKKPMSVQIKKDYDAMTKYDDNPKKAARKANKDMEKKKRASQKARAKHNKKVHVKTKTTKGKTGGDK
jgi:hypothetical protein